MQCPLTEREAERLAELESLAVVGRETIPELQALCELAAGVVHTPVALVSLVGEHAQTFVANVGLPGVDGTPRDIAFCAHAILGPEPLVVGDALRDGRFRSNPLVTGPLGVRAYAGIPLETAPGYRVGTLCALDFKRRRFSTAQIHELQKLALAATRILTGHRTQAELLAALRDHAKNEAALEHAARHDPLTGVANGTWFRERATDLMTRATEADAMALLLLDVDHFKLVNDRYGQGYADNYLVTLAAALVETLGPSALVGRVGGDEFAVLVPVGESRDTEARAIVERVRDRARAAARQLGKSELGRLSFGVAFTPQHAIGYDEVHRRADVALSAAKAAGRDTTVIFAPSLLESANPRVRRSKLLLAIERGEFAPFYQPKIDLHSGKLAGFEVLARWRHPADGLLGPETFAAAFDDRVVAPLLTRALLRRAFADIRLWRQAGLDIGGLSFNATTADLRDPMFPKDVEALARAYHVPLDRLTVEVTEHVVLGREGESVYAVLAALRASGLQIALDDFGTGYGGLQHLRSWPIDRIKIDRSFVKDCLSSAQDQAILRSIVNLGRELGLSVVAEGIENQAQADLLKGLSCDLGQGYHFAKPMTAAEVAHYLAAWRVTPAASVA